MVLESGPRNMARTAIASRYGRHERGKAEGFRQMSPRLIWGGVVVVYVVAGTIWLGLLQSEGPPKNASHGTERYERWKSQKYRYLKRLWIWATGLAVLLTGMMSTIVPE
jgi:hypothetical protein